MNPKFIQLNRDIILVDDIKYIYYFKNEDQTYVAYKDKTNFKFRGDVRNELWDLLKQALGTDLDVTSPEPTPAPEEAEQFNIGDKVVIRYITDAFRGKIISLRSEGMYIVRGKWDNEYPNLPNSKDLRIPYNSIELDDLS
jgi:hypothetical protein